jgi:UDP-glucose 4-epimerase
LPIDENHPLVAFNPYADSKILGENLCKSYFQFFNVKSIIVRPFNLYGRGQHDNFLISSIIKQATTGKIKLQSSAPKRDYIYIDDMVSAYLKLINYNNSALEIFNIGSGISHSVKEITEMINSLFNNELEIHFSEKERQNEVDNTIANIEKAKKLLQWEPQITLKEGLKKCFDE